MRRAWVLILSALLVAPTAGAELRRSVELDRDAYLLHRIEDVPEGTTIRIEVRASAPVDVVVLRADRFEAFRRGDLADPGPGGALATRDHAARASVGAGDWIVVVDNTVVPPTGAVPTGGVVVEATVERVGEPTGTGDVVEALTFGANHLRLGSGFAVAGVTIWMIGLAVVACPRRRRVAIWMGTATIGAFLASQATPAGVVTRTGISIGLGVLAAVEVGRDDPVEALRTAYVVPFVGVLVGADLLHGPALAGRLPEGSVLVIGGGGILDALVLAPVGALWATAAWYLLVTDDPGRRLVGWARDRLARLGKTIN